MKIPSTKIILFFSIILVFYGCNTTSRKKVDLVVYDATIYSMDDEVSIYSIMVVDDGKIVTMGGEELRSKYQGEETLYLKDKFIYPGLIDAHSHFYGLGQTSVTVDLRGVQSQEEMIQ